jgi:hypothetical protein
MLFKRCIQSTFIHFSKMPCYDKCVLNDRNKCVLFGEYFFVLDGIKDVFISGLVSGVLFMMKSGF